MEEIFRDVKGYEGYYQVSNLGNVISLERIIIEKSGKKYLRKGKLMSTIKSHGYLEVRLSKNSKSTSCTIHSLVWNAFGDGTELKFPEIVIDHIDRDKTNNRIDNLRAVTTRVNCQNRVNNRDYIGVIRQKNIFLSRIKIKNKDYYLGNFNTPEEAHERYLEACNNLDNFEEWLDKIKPKKQNLIGVHKKGVKFISVINIKRKLYRLGTFKTAEEAHERYLEARNNLDNFEEWYNKIRPKKQTLLGAHKDGSKFCSRIFFKNKTHRLGSFKTPEEANERYLEAKNNLDNFEEWLNAIKSKK
jgi:hypothetical protein